jgi:hypothetical protein
MKVAIDPIPESTTIFNGSGVSSVRGVPSGLSANAPAVLDRDKQI